MGVDLEEDMKRLPIELNLRAARKRQSSRTGFVHHCYESNEHEQETIPLFENFCFCLALLRSKQTENVLEGIALLEKLLKFEKEGNFPVYLHEYPECKDRFLGAKLVVVFQAILNGFQTILDPSLKRELERLIQDKRVDVQFNPDVLSTWHPMLCTFVTPQLQEKENPKPTLLDFFMCDYYKIYPERLLIDHPIHLRTALVYPLEKVENNASWRVPHQEISTHPKQPYTLYWGSLQQVHSLVCDPKESQCQMKSVENGAQLIFTLNSLLRDEMPIEFAFFCNLHPEHTLYVNGQKATTFQLNDTVEIHSGTLCIRLRFDLLEGEGIFFGQLSRANRPLQTGAKGAARYEVYDWQIALRAVRRAERCTLAASVSWSQVEEEPGCPQPLPSHAGHCLHTTSSL